MPAYMLGYVGMLGMLEFVIIHQYTGLGYIGIFSVHWQMSGYIGMLGILGSIGMLGYFGHAWIHHAMLVCCISLGYVGAKPVLVYRSTHL